MQVSGARSGKNPGDAKARYERTTVVDDGCCRRDSSRSVGACAGDWAVKFSFVHSGFAGVAGTGCWKPSDVEAGPGRRPRCAADGADADRGWPASERAHGYG